MRDRKGTDIPNLKPSESEPLDELTAAHEILRVRLSQMLINEKYKAGEFLVPIHLALGHEAIAVAVSATMGPEDQLVLPHRNLHYNLARGAPLKAVLDEFLLRPEGLAAGTLGSMNLRHEAGGVVYTSSILGNNFGVGTGVALAQRMTGSDGITIIVTGDGAMEEGAFHECLVMLCSQDLPALIVVENNQWSMATRIEERRRPIDLARLAEAYGGTYARLSGNDVCSYAETLQRLRMAALANTRPCVVEVDLSTLGDRQLVNSDHPNGKHINYHAGPAPEISVSAWPLIRETDEDPVHVLGRRMDKPMLERIAETFLADLTSQIT